ncbi:DUF5777 family beta-barrel protein [Aquimarina spongiae]|uniref:DUF5777 domain-containing protein n=1 Tax=Aquimarina spongiae TaxID=570521 RepID=A0A1M6J1X2_9FLAO|nr:DUF5777 family beta-barrel protein [Aquimarina spongiae]SHJ40659.1 hypothetical protein SAMN04488508_108196 [Aquimarina spongiae]
MKSNIYIFFIVLVYFGNGMQAQSLLDELNESYTDPPQFESAVFKSSRISIGHSTKTLQKGVLEIGARNRFWNVADADIQSFVADKMSTRFSLEYGVNDRFTFGLGGTTLDGIFDGFLKYKLVRQQKKGFPFTITLLQNSAYQSERPSIGDVHKSSTFGDKLSFTSQLLMSRKITSQFSLQLSPTFLHRASSNFEEDPNNHFALGIGGRYKVGGHISIVSEYYHLFNPLESRDTYNAFALGVNWELSDVMLQFQMTNAQGVEEHNFITQTPNNFNFNDGNFVFGFTAIFILHTRNGLKK